MSMILRSLITFKNLATVFELPSLWSAVTCWSVYGESWFSALICTVFPRVDTFSTCKVWNKTWRVSLHFRVTIFVIRWVL
ncbi:hypothetical protein C0J52_15789 [Blattella germanica]|nr:hypothetical protein C0J52_15789 [Blattella germanica]